MTSLLPPAPAFLNQLLGAAWAILWRHKRVLLTLMLGPIAAGILGITLGIEDSTRAVADDTVMAFTAWSVLSSIIGVHAAAMISEVTPRLATGTPVGPLGPLVARAARVTGWLALPIVALSVLSYVLLGVIGSTLLGGAMAGANGVPGARVMLTALSVALLAVPVAMALAVRIVYIIPVMVFEGRGLLDGCRRAWQLTRGNFWRTLGWLLVIGLIGGAISQFAAPFGGAVKGIVSLMVDAFNAIAVALMYLDQRARQEQPRIAVHYPHVPAPTTPIVP